MNTLRIVPAAVVAGLAMAAALVTANFIQAAEDAANVPVRQTAAAPSHDSLWAYHPSGLFVFVDHTLVSTVDPMPARHRERGPGARAVDPGQGIGTAPTDAAVASEEARNQADLDALFAVAVRVKPASVEAPKNVQGERGKRVYMDLCYACHQPDGQGLPGTFPMLAKSDYMAADRTRAIRIVLEGLAGPVTVNGETINSVMPAQKTVLTDQQIADVLTYVFNAWENPGGAFTTKEVEAIRAEKSRD